MSSLRDAEGHDAIDTNCRKQETQGAKTCKQNHAEAIDRQGLAHDLINRPDTSERHIRIN